MKIKYKIFHFVLLAFLMALQSCDAQEEQSIKTPIVNTSAAYGGIGISGSTEDVTVATTSGIVLMGGGTDVDNAIAWMIDRAKGGDFIILRATGSTGYNDYIKGLGDLNSVETLLIDSRQKALRTEVGKRIREAEAVFIAGGDQANYVNYWSDSEVSSALHYLINEKKIPIGGTSAGCAILSELIFDAKKGSVISSEALANPYDPLMSLSKSFLQIPMLTNTIADQHYSQRDRHGRHVAFMARMMTDFSLPEIKGIGVDEQTAVCIDANGELKIFGKNKAFFILSNDNAPEKCEASAPLTWQAGDKALKVFIYSGSSGGTNAFNLHTWPEIPTQFWSVKNGVLKKIEN